MPRDIQETAPAVNSVQDETRNECEECGDYIDHGDEWERPERFGSYCESCYDDSRSDCDNCGDTYDDDNLTDGMCRYCYDNEGDEDGVSKREYSTEKLPQFMSKDTGEFITSPRIFSAELECYYPDDEAMRKVAKALPKEYGIEQDGSLNSRGIEFQTPMLQGKNGEDSIKAACAILNEHGFETDQSAGLHIHLDGQGLMPKTRTKHEPHALAQAFMFYISFEDVLMSFLPPSRRANRFCMSLRADYHAKEIAGAKSLEGLEQIWYRVKRRDQLKEAKEGKYHHSRYFGLNLHSLLKDGHVEIRFHSGTTNATKILEWTNLHQTILDKCVGRRVKEETFGFSYRMARSMLDPIPFAEAEPEPQYVWRMRAGNIGTEAMRSAHLNGLTERTEAMFDMLDLPDRARKYFKARQKAFISTTEDKDEKVCAA